MESDTSTLEEKEALLTDACVRHLSQANHQVAGLQDELCAKTEVMVKQQDDIKNLMAKVIALETQLKKVGQDTAQFFSTILGLGIPSHVMPDQRAFCDYPLRFVLNLTSLFTFTLQ